MTRLHAIPQGPLTEGSAKRPIPLHCDPHRRDDPRRARQRHHRAHLPQHSRTQSIEATMTFPVPVDATLCSLTARIDGRTLRAVAQARSAGARDLRRRRRRRQIGGSARGTAQGHPYAQRRPRRSGRRNRGHRHLDRAAVVRRCAPRIAHPDHGRPTLQAARRCRPADDLVAGDTSCTRRRPRSSSARTERASLAAGRGADRTGSFRVTLDRPDRHRVRQWPGWQQAHAGGRRRRRAAVSRWRSRRRRRATPEPRPRPAVRPTPARWARAPPGDRGGRGVQARGWRETRPGDGGRAVTA